MTKHASECFPRKHILVCYFRKIFRHVQTSFGWLRDRFGTSSGQLRDRFELVLDGFRMDSGQVRNAFFLRQGYHGDDDDDDDDDNDGDQGETLPPPLRR